MRLKKHEFRVDRGSRNRTYGTPKELWGFRLKVPAGGPEAIARRFLRENADHLGIEQVVPRLRTRAILYGAGATHVILQQHHDRVAVHRAFVTVHIARNHEIYLVKNRVTPPEHLPKNTRFHLTAVQARKRAARYLQEVAEPAESTRTSHPVKRWFYVDGRLRPSWRVRVHRTRPREEWILYVDARTSAILSEYDNLAWATGRANVFDPNPIAAAGGWRTLYDLAEHEVRSPPHHALKSRKLHGLDGRGFLDGVRVSTRLTARRVRKPGHDYRVGWREAGFHEAMVYYHLDTAARYLNTLGFTGKRSLFNNPIEVDVHWSDEDNSNFDPAAKTLQFGTGGVPDAEDAEVIIHEFGHALQDAICPDFGQSHQAAAMGEGFGDYLAGSLFERKKLKGYRHLVMSWSGLPWEEVWVDTGSRTRRPYLRKLNEEMTYADFVHRLDQEHRNGPIWSSTLWAIREALGNARLADRIIIDSHFQLDGYTKLVRGARAIIDADVNLCRGRHLDSLLEIFAERGIGPVHVAGDGVGA